MAAKLIAWRRVAELAWTKLCSLVKPLFGPTPPPRSQVNKKVVLLDCLSSIPGPRIYWLGTASYRDFWGFFGLIKLWQAFYKHVFCGFPNCTAGGGVSEPHQPCVNISVKRANHRACHMRLRPSGSSRPQAPPFFGGFAKKKRRRKLKMRKHPFAPLTPSLPLSSFALSFCQPPLLF